MQPRKQWQKVGDKIFRVPRVKPWRIPMALVPQPRFRSVSIAGIIWGFAAVIGVGAVLLMLPISRAQATPVPLGEALPDALFTATSATCVTGLIVHETGTYWSSFGQAVILVLMHIGGLGFMAGASLLLLALGQRVGLRQKILISESMGTEKLGGLVSLLVGIGFFTIFSEGIGAVVLYIRFSQDFSSPGMAIWQSLFHSVSSFCNAGFDILGGDSLIRYNGDPLVILTTAALVITGGISFLVAWDVVRTRGFRRLSLDAKMVIVMTVALLALGTIVLLDDILFETVSAFGTVGLSTGITPALSLAGKLIIIATMFAGRLGPLTLALSLVRAQRSAKYRYPHDQLRIG